mmetsp:Transcript_70277/g.187256  ORF Transcript_70277/g.187256 Transcript_70277/m.187256 type:complete len:107 (+) Transcript_70277:924-1244(+)
MAKLRAILEQKEKIAVEAVNDNLGKRVAKLEGEMEQYSKTQPHLQTLLDDAGTLLKECSTDTHAFVASSQDLLPRIEKATVEASALAPPTDNASFDSLQLNLITPP